MPSLLLPTLAAVAGFSVIQSLFGMGVLIFGTPILLLLGYSFEETLSLLLPCSLTINLLQVIPVWHDVAPIRRRLLTFLIPFVIAGSLLVVLTHFSASLKPFIGAILVMTALLQTTKKSLARLQQFIHKNQFPAFALTGFLQGATNMGGGLFTILMNSLFSDKESVRANIAMGYLMMASAQVLTLGISGNFHWSWQTLVFPIVAGLTYWTIGNRIFKIPTQRMYQHLMTAFMAIFGLLLLTL